MQPLHRPAIASIAPLALTALVLLLAGCAKTPSGKVTADDASMGSPDAKITVIEYASVACPLCARFNRDVMPELKAKYIDTGKIHYVFRPMMTGNPAVATAGHRLAECAGKDKYFNVVDAVMRSQEAMGGEETGYANARPVLLNIAASIGMSEADFTKCVTDAKAVERLNTLNENYMKDDNITGTPTFVINGKTLTRKKGDISDFDEAFKPYLKGQ